MKPHPTNINSPLMQCLEKMLEAELKMSQFEAAANATGVVSVETPDLGLFDHVLTTMGFPEDNTTSFSDDGEIPWHEHPECFCRDWLSDKWVDDVLRGDMTIPEYIAWAQCELSVN